MISAELKTMAIEFLTLIAAGKIAEAFAHHVGTGFRHHNPSCAGDASSLQEAMAQNASQYPDKIFEIQRALEDGSEVAVFSRVRQHRDDLGVAVVHIFRFENNRIVELWDIGQPVPKESINQNGMF